MKKYFIFLIIIAVVIALVLEGQNIQINGIKKSISPQSSTQAQSNPENIVPGSMPQFSCPAQTQGQALVSITGIRGLLVYKINGITDYVLHNGAKGNIAYSTSRTGFIETSAGLARVGYGSAAAAPSNQTYNITFYHQTHVTESYKVLQVNTTNQSGRYRLCGNIPTVGTVCGYQSSNATPTNTDVYVTSLTHPGVSSYIVRNKFGTQNVTIDAGSSAQLGTYWITIGGTPCNGGQVALLTVGSSQYNGTISNTINIHS